MAARRNAVLLFVLMVAWCVPLRAETFGHRLAILGPDPCG